MDDTPWLPPSERAPGDVPGFDAAAGSTPASAAVTASNPMPPVPPLPTAVAGPTSPTLPPAPAVVVPPAPPAPRTPAGDGYVAANPWQRPIPGATPDGVPVASDPNTVDVQPSAAPKRRSRGLMAVAAVGVVAVGAAGVFAISRFTDRTEGGAASPEELGASLLTALENEDVLGAFDLLLPAERDLVRQPSLDLVAELVRLEVLSPEADLANIGYVDVTVANGTATPVSTNVPDIVTIDLQGEVTATIDGATVPIGDLISDNISAEEMAEVRATNESTTEALDAEVVAVEQDGRWFVSIGYTIAEQARKDAMPDAQIPLEGIGAVGAESPEAAFDKMLDAVEALDVRGMIQGLNPGEAGALQRYAPLFIDDGEAEIASGVAEAGFQWSITDRQFHVDGDGPQRTIILDAISVEGSFDEGDGQVTFAAEFAGECMSVNVDAPEQPDMFDFSQCAGDPLTVGGFDELMAEMPAVQAFLDALGEALADIEPIGVEVREYEGAWYVSAFATYTEAYLKLLRALDRAEIDRLIELGEPALEEFFDGWFGGFGELAAGDDWDDFAVEEDYASFEDMSADDGFVVDGTADDPYVFEETGAAFEPSGAELCYNELDPALAATCFQGYVDAGEYDPAWVPVALRHPECGLLGSWDGSLSQLPDAEFIAAVTAAKPCFEALVASGELDSYDIPYEVLMLECYEGRNWYTVYDDPAYTDRVLACSNKVFEELG